MTSAKVVVVGSIPLLVVSILDGWWMIQEQTP